MLVEADGTRGQQLLERARQVKMHGRSVPVHAEIVQVSDFSVHADGDEIIAWLSRLPGRPHHRLRGPRRTAGVGGAGQADW